MSSEKEVIGQTVNLMLREVRSVNQQVKQELKEDAPETTATRDIYFGTPSAIPDTIKFGNDIDYEDYLGAVLTSYLESAVGREVKSPYRNFVNQENPLTGKSNDFDWSSKKQISGGTYHGDKCIWSEHLPYAELERLEEILVSELPEHPLKEHLVSFPRAFISKMSETYEDVNYRTLKHVISHELTHDYIRRNSKIGKLRDYKESEEVLKATDMERWMSESMGDKSGLVTVKRQVDRVSKNSSLTTIEEIFAFFVANHYAVRNAPREPEDFPEEFYNPRKISWGIKILEKKSEEIHGSIVDWARKKSVDTFDKIAEKGQVRNPQGKRELEAIFLLEALPEAEKEKLKKFREICEGELKTAFSDFKLALKDIEEDIGAVKEIKRLESEVDWDNPAHIEDIVLHRSAARAVEEMLPLSKTLKIFNRNMEKEARNLKKYIKQAKLVESELKNKKHRRELEKVVSELTKTEKDIEEIISS